MWQLDALNGPLRVVMVPCLSHLLKVDGVRYPRRAFGEIHQRVYLGLVGHFNVYRGLYLVGDKAASWILTPSPVGRDPH